MSKHPNKMTLQSLITQTVMAHDLLPAGAPVLLMVSGGSDSVAMARLMPQLYPQNQFFVLHVNHLLRGAAAEKDERFVLELCAQLGLPCKVERVNVAAIAAEQGDNLEQAGRKQRYTLANAELDRLCAAHNIAPAQGRIATAHTTDDRAETFLMRVIVGGGGGSLSSIPYQNQRVVRPLLDCNREDLREWLLGQECQRGGVCQGDASPDTAAQCHEEASSVSPAPLFTSDTPPWREDASNADTSYSRAFVRHELLPLLQSRNPRIVETLAKTTKVLATESAYLDEQAQALLPITAKSFDAPLAVLRRAIYLTYKQAADQLAPDARIDFEHIDLIAANGARPGFACHLAGGIEARNVKGILRFSPAKPPKHRPIK